MTIDRRDFLKGGVALSALAFTIAQFGRLDSASSSTLTPGPWRTFDVVTRIEIPDAANGAHAWVPLPSVAATEWSRPLGDSWDANSPNATLHTVGATGAKLLAVSWPSGATPVVTVTSRVTVRDRSADLSAPRKITTLSEVDRAMLTAGSERVPTDGIVRENAQRITRGASDDLAKVRALYDWMVVNTYRDGNVRGCGSGDIVAMLRSGKLGGKCADLNALFVGFARSVGVPARELYGIRVAPSRFGYRSLGANTPDITKAQHCRAEVYLNDFGWVAMDPADVRKVMLEEPPGNLALSDVKPAAARQMLFGASEGNWIAYSDARDVRLPGSAGPAVGFLMYPQAETAAGRLDCLDPASFKYTITAKEIAV